MLTFEDKEKKTFNIENTKDFVKYMFYSLITYNQIKITFEEFADAIDFDDINTFTNELVSGSKKKVQEVKKNLFQRLKSFLSSL